MLLLLLRTLAPNKRLLRVGERLNELRACEGLLLFRRERSLRLRSCARNRNQSGKKKRKAAAADDSTHTREELLVNNCLRLLNVLQFFGEHRVIGLQCIVEQVRQAGFTQVPGRDKAVP